MLYIHFCKDCERIFMLNGHRITCPRCELPLHELQLSYSEYVFLTPLERKLLAELCLNEAALTELEKSNRVIKYGECPNNYFNYSTLQCRQG